MATLSLWGLVIERLLPKMPAPCLGEPSGNPLQTRLSLCIHYMMQLLRRLDPMSRFHLPSHRRSRRTLVPLLTRPYHADCLDRQMNLSTRHHSSDVEIIIRMLLCGARLIDRVRWIMPPRCRGIWSATFTKTTCNVRDQANIAENPMAKILPNPLDVLRACQ